MYDGLWNKFEIDNFGTVFHSVVQHSFQNTDTNLLLRLSPKHFYTNFGMGFVQWELILTMTLVPRTRILVGHLFNIRARLLPYNMIHYHMKSLAARDLYDSESCYNVYETEFPLKRRNDVFFCGLVMKVAFRWQCRSESLYTPFAPVSGSCTVCCCYDWSV